MSSPEGRPLIGQPRDLKGWWFHSFSGRLCIRSRKCCMAQGLGVVSSSGMHDGQDPLARKAAAVACLSWVIESVAHKEVSCVAIGGPSQLRDVAPR